MSGGQLLVLDRAGREVKQFDLSSGSATLGSDPSCDIRVMLPSVQPHHASIVVHANQSVVRNMGSGETLLNGVSVSVAALRQDDIISVGGRELRWRYLQPMPQHARRRPDSPALQLRGGRGAKGGRGRRSEGGRSQVAPNHHRDSAPAAISTRQVAIVQPQRRDTADHIESVSNSAISIVTNVRRRGTVRSDSELDTSLNKIVEDQNGSRSPKSSSMNLQNTTKATLWIESRKSSPRKSVKVKESPRKVITPKKAFSAKKSTPLRMAVLKKAQSAQKMRVTKIQAPLTIDYTKRAALMLMAGHSPQRLPKGPSPRRRGRPCKAGAAGASLCDFADSVLEITDSDAGESSAAGSEVSAPCSPRKSALRDPSLKKGRRTDSIKFDLSHLSHLSEPAPALRHSLGSSPPRPPPRPSARASRGSLIVSRALQTRPSESYSIVDLVSVDSSSSLYDSATDTPLQPRPSRGRSLLASTTPAPRRHTASFYDSTFGSTSGQRSKSATPGDSTENTFDVTATRKTRSLGEPDPPNLTFDISRRSRKSLLTPDNSKENVSVVQTNFTVNRDTFNVSSKSRKTRSTLSEGSLDNITLNSTKSLTASTNRSQKGDVLAWSDSESPVHEHDGTSTPKNQTSPEAAGTPVLSIQSLLDSSHNITLPRQSRKKGMSRIDLKRKTIGSRLSVPRKRASLKSQSYNLGTRKSLRSRKSSRNSPTDIDSTKDSTQDDGDTTPKSAVKLVQEAVKNKHSTAKKPKSKRSIIDNLNDSDIVKQLFNSPVKRKLSQSMIEFSKRQLLEEMSPRRPTRNTIAATAETPDNAATDQSQVFTPEIFVSPLTTPNASPNVAGIKRLFAKTTPDNDLRNVRGVKKLLQTPRLRRSVRNDLTRVSGVKSVFAKSPKNRLSDVAIKDVFAASPRNDLRRVSGVKSLFQSQKKRESPKNDLTDVSNVRNLFKKQSPRNDLANVSGVKGTMRRNSPRNNLSDVRGVRKLFHLEKQKDDLNNISGIEELFSESHQTSNVTDANSESSFNLLIGRPAVRAYPKAKSFTTKTIAKPKTRKAKSLQTSFSLISNNVENWLENELKKRMHKEDTNVQAKKSLDKSIDEEISISTTKYNRDKSSIAKNRSELSKSAKNGRKSNSVTEINSSKATKSKVDSSNANASPNLFKSKNKSNQTRELLKLATDTVQGTTPVLTTRARNSTLTKTFPEGKRSTSEIYGAHTLPIKKRSLVETSRGEKALPIKKRAVMHSTPVKGRLNITMNASEIGRVSPIAPMAPMATMASIAPMGPMASMAPMAPKAALSERYTIADANSALNPEARSTESVKNSPKQKEIQARSVKVIPLAEVIKDNISPAPRRATRGRKTRQSLDMNNVKKRKSSIVIAKKTPALSPKPTNVTNEKPLQAEKATPGKRKTRVTNLQIETEKNDNNLKSKPGRKKLVDADKKASTDQSPKTRQTRGQKTAEKAQTPKKVTRSKVSKVGIVIAKPSPLMKPSAKKTTKANATAKTLKRDTSKTRHAKAEKSNPPLVKQKKTLSKTSSSETNETLSQVASTTKNTRNNEKNQNASAEKESTSNAKSLESQTDVEKPRRGRKTVRKSEEQTETVAPTRSTRNTDKQKSTDTTSQKLKKTASQESNKAKNNSNVQNNVSSQTATRGRKRKIAVEESPSKIQKRTKDDDIATRKQGKKVEKQLSDEQENNKGRQKKKLNSLESSQQAEPPKEAKTRGRQKKQEDKAATEPSKTVNSRGNKTSANKKEDISNKVAENEVKNVRGRKKQSVEEETPAKAEKSRRNRRGEGDAASSGSAAKTQGDVKAKNSRRQKADEPVKPLAGRKRKTETSAAKEVSQPSKTRKTSAASPKATRGRVAKVQEVQKPAARSRRR